MSNQLVKTKEEIENNLIKFEDYLCSNNTEESTFAYELIKKGHCFIVYTSNNEFQFAPSRYIGYLNKGLD